MVLVSISVLTLATAVFSINVFFHTAYLNLMVISAAMMTFFSVSNAVIQSTVSDEYQGKSRWPLHPDVGTVPVRKPQRRIPGGASWSAPHATQIAAGVMLLLFSLAVWRIKVLRHLG